MTKSCDTPADFEVDPSCPSRRKWHFLWLGVLLLLAFGLRAAFALQIESPPASDSLGYHVQATHIAEENRLYGDDKHSTYHPPGYAFALGLIYKAVGVGNFTAVRVLQCILGTIAAFLVYDIVRVCAGNMAGLVALGGFALLTSNIFIAGLLLTENTFIPLSLLFFRLLLIPQERQRMWLIVVTGMTGAAAILTRPEFLPVIGVAGLALLLRNGPREWKRNLRPALCLVLSAAVCVCAWTARNAVKYHQFVPVATCWGRTIYETTKPPYYPDVKTFRQMNTQNLSEVEEDHAFRAAIYAAYRNHTRFYATKYLLYKQWRSVRHLLWDNRLWFPLPEGPALLGMEYPPSMGNFGFWPVRLLRAKGLAFPTVHWQAVLVIFALGLLFIPVLSPSFLLLAGYIAIGYFWLSVVLYPQELRFWLVYEPAALILGVIGLANARTALRRRWYVPAIRLALFTGVAAIILCPPVHGVVTSYFDAKPCVDHVNKNAQPGDAVLVDQRIADDFNWFFSREPGVLVGYENGLYSAGKVGGALQLEMLARNSRRVWLVLSRENPHADTYLDLARQWYAAESKESSGLVSCYLFTR